MTEEENTDENIDSTESDVSEGTNSSASEEEVEATDTEAAENQEVSEEAASEAIDESVDDVLASELAPMFSRTRLRGFGIFALGFASTLLLMAYHGQLKHGSLVGLVTVLVTVFGLLDFLGMLRSHPSKPIAFSNTSWGQVGDEGVWAQPRYMFPITVAIILLGAIFGGYDTLPMVIIAGLLMLLPSAIYRPGLMVFLIVAGIYYPLLGASGLWDPWETHYGEVAREILSRNDWISLWWAHEHWFMSKPILIFWSEALSMSAIGVDFRPDSNWPHPEWAVRLPVCTFAVAAVMTVYGTIKKIFSTRAGAIAALALATAPHFFLLSHQAITDMYLVSNLVMACCMLLCAMSEDPTRLVQSVRIGPFCLSFRHLVLGGIALLAFPQAIYLISRNITMYDGFKFALHLDEFMWGSAGNGGLPGHDPVRPVQPIVGAIQPVVQGLIWLTGLFLIAWNLRKERRARALFMTAFYVFCALAFMGKGIPGFALPGLIALLYLIASRRWKLLGEGSFRVGWGALIIPVIGLPWYVGMFMRHGAEFTDRLLVHDHLNRLAQGVHGDKGSIEYFLEQLGVAAFPWIALVPTATLLFLWHRRRTEPTATTAESTRAYNQEQSLLFIGLWFFAAFTLFSAMITKFHHYIFPAVPPAAILSGILVERMWGRAAEGLRGKLITMVAVLSPIPAVLGVGGLYGNLRGYIPETVAREDQAGWAAQNGMSAGLAYLLIAVGVGLFAFAAHQLWLARKDDEPTKAEQNFSTAMSVAMAAGACLGIFVARELSFVTTARPQGFERLINLYIYNYKRVWPTEFDYEPVLTGFAIVASVIFILAVFKRLRPAASRALVGFALLFCAWGLNFYFFDLSQHWGMRPLFKHYYEMRGEEDIPVIAWQMNWKGENFYTGNRVYIFVDLDNKKIKKWMADNPEQSAFYVFEHTRFGSFKNLVRGRKITEVTSKRQGNKFKVIHVAGVGQPDFDVSRANTGH